MESETNRSVNAEAIAYFNKVVLDYSKGDVKELLVNSKRAGPLLQVTANGIDLLGGMCYGFCERSSGKRSTRFMSEHMDIEDSLARVLYKCVRCGIVHQGVPSIGFVYFISSERLPDHQIVLKAPGDKLLLDVQELAYRYIDAIERIACKPEDHIRYIPPLKHGDKEVFRKVLSRIPGIDIDVAPILGLASYSARTLELKAWFFEVSPESVGKPSGCWD